MTATPRRAEVAAAFLAVYVVWGSTYLGIRWAIDTMPPFLMAGSRFLAAGALLYAWQRLRGDPAPLRLHWRSAAVVGGLMLLGGNGGVTWAEQFIPTGLAALLVGLVPVWMVLLNWVGPERARPTPAVLGGLALGFLGVAILVGPGTLAGAEGLHLLGALAIVGGTSAWAMGSLLSRRMPLPSSGLLATAMEMLAGGALLSLVGLATGEAARVDLGAISPLSAGSWLYLVVFGSIVAFSCYTWLLRVTTPARVATYAFVNPVVAVLLGWALAAEPVTLRTLAAAGVIVTGVAVITQSQAALLAGQAAARRARAAFRHLPRRVRALHR